MIYDGTERSLEELITWWGKTLPHGDIKYSLHGTSFGNWDETCQLYFVVGDRETKINNGDEFTYENELMYINGEAQTI